MFKKIIQVFRGKATEQAARTTPYVPSRVGPRNVTPSLRVLKVAKQPPPQRRGRSHLEPRWDSHFVDMSDGDESPPGDPQGTNDFGAI
jgi:hypothetical protein